MVKTYQNYLTELFETPKYTITKTRMNLPETLEYNFEITASEYDDNFSIREVHPNHIFKNGDKFLKNNTLYSVKGLPENQTITGREAINYINLSKNYIEFNSRDIDTEENTISTNSYNVRNNVPLRDNQRYIYSPRYGDNGAPPLSPLKYGSQYLIKDYTSIQGLTHFSLATIDSPNEIIEFGKDVSDHNYHLLKGSSFPIKQEKKVKQEYELDLHTLNVYLNPIIFKSTSGKFHLMKEVFPISIYDLIVPGFMFKNEDNDIIMVVVEKTETYITGTMKTKTQISSNKLLRFEILFPDESYIVDVSFINESGSYAITSEGNAFNVFSTVLDILKTKLLPEFKRRNKKISHFIFTAAEESRRKLYRALIKRYAILVQERGSNFIVKLKS